MADARIHCANKHPKKTFEELFRVAGESEDDGPADDELPDSKNAWNCVFSKNTMFSDGYTTKETFEGKVMEVMAHEVTIGGSIVIDLV